MFCMGKAKYREILRFRRNQILVAEQISKRDSMPLGMQYWVPNGTHVVG